MDLVFGLLLCIQTLLASSPAVRDESDGALISAVGNDPGTAAGRSTPDSLNARQSLRLQGSWVWTVSGAIDDEGSDIK